jgi:rhomboid protease GluP
VIEDSRTHSPAAWQTSTYEAPPPRSRSIAPITTALIVINVCVFFLESLAGGTTNVSVLLRLGAAARPLVAAGQWWRLFACMFLHAGPLHLGANMFSLWLVGRVTERLLGASRFLVVYMTGGIVGSTLGLASTAGASVGASAAIIGLLSPLFLFTYGQQEGGWFRRLRTNLVRWFPTIALLGLQGILIPHVNNLAHAGGVIGGALAAVIVGVDVPWHVTSRTRVAHVIAGIGALLTLIALGLAAQHAVLGERTRRSVVVGGVEFSLPDISYKEVMDGVEVAAVGEAILVARTRPVATGETVRPSEAVHWMDEYTVGDLGDHARRIAIGSDTVRGVTALHARYVAPGKNGGSGDAWILHGPTRVALVEILTPAGFTLPQATMRQIVESARVP